MAFRLLWIWCFLTFAGVAQSADFRVTFINPGGETGFWGDVSRTMAAAAADLNVELEILYADRQPYIMEALLKKRLDDGDLPDYFVLVNENQSAARLLQLMDGKPSKVFFLLNKLTAKQKNNLERHNIDLRNIVASIVPDNETAGYEMAQSLIEKARKLKPQGEPIHLLALTGDTTTPAGLQRETGMLRAVADNPDVRLLHAIPTDWNETIAFRRARDVFARTKVDVVWGANDDIAFGALKAAVEAGLIPGENIFFAGLNWSLRGMEAVREQNLTMTHGGHFFAGAWSMVMLRDHFFRTVEGEVFVDVLFKMSPVTLENVDLYLTNLGDGNWEKIDFSQFRKTGSGRSHYDFSASAILEAAGS
ncbi:ABC transporter substrate-binding protein [Roseibium marinum]|uniref:ABC-type sugar transport system substrate-binding protein n=1 Tax=Roseibium marinum TaxID=281252 RepID=A0A2S3ULK9_9HYPH|nr:ABC transporter substrate-binding protein [Roseibium marinum]POF28586.1 ABC-type sugar transport system substrate-binding protein [Roseibium marinum]